MIKHDRKGNCWDGETIYDRCPECRSEMCDVCHKHDEPRGECSKCPPCPGCDAEEKLAMGSPP